MVTNEPESPPRRGCYRWLVGSLLISTALLLLACATGGYSPWK